MRYFGTDGIRGKFNDIITEELAYKLGRSLVYFSNKVVVATDTRSSKDVLAKSLIDGVLSCGGEVVYAGVVPTAALIYYSFINNIVGVMITASHNPYSDNGLKVVYKGVKLDDVSEVKIEEMLSNKVVMKSYEKINIDYNVKELYLNFFNNFMFKSNFKVIIDCANGATFETAETILKKMCNLKVIANKPNGININDNVGSTHLNNILKYSMDYDIGFSFDGDGDRVIVVEGDKVIDGDLIIYIIACYLKNNNSLENNTVVLTKMSNLGILKKFDEIGIKYVLTDVGDKNVVDCLVSNGYSIGGENSGHIIIPDILKTGDGLLVSILLLKIMDEYKTTLSKLIEDIILYEDRMVNLTVENKDIIDSFSVKEKIDEIENKLDGKVIVRKSGTENVVRVSVMAKTKKEVDYYIDELVGVIKEGL